MTKQTSGAVIFLCIALAGCGISNEQAEAGKLACKDRGGVLMHWTNIYGGKYSVVCKDRTDISGAVNAKD